MQEALLEYSAYKCQSDVLMSLFCLCFVVCLLFVSYCVSFLSVFCCFLFCLLFVCCLVFVVAFVVLL